MRRARSTAALQRPRFRRPRWLVAIVLGLLLGSLGETVAAPPGCPDGAWPNGPPSDPGYDNSWWLFSCMPTNAPLATDSRNASGMSVDRAWAYSTGRGDVVYAYMEGGPDWQFPDTEDFANRTYLNRGELPLPRTAAGMTKPDLIVGGTVFEHTDPYDLNDDGLFTIKDFGDDARVTDWNDSGFLDAQDAIVAFRDWCVIGGTWQQDAIACEGVDNDGNGYAHDISGWDFWRDDNDPTSDQSYQHPAEWVGNAVGEANNGLRGANSSVGVCPDCLVMFVRVAPAVLIDTDRFARSVAYAADAGAAVASISAGAMLASSAGQEALDYAWRKGMIFVSGSHDLGTNHHLSPNTLYDHVLVANAMGPQMPFAQLRTSYREWASIGSFGMGNILAGIPDAGSYSQTSPMFGGVAGLIVSYARDLVDEGRLTRPLTPSEFRQVLIASADPMEDADHTRPDSFRPKPGSASGWSQYYGYGRVNVHRAMQMLDQGIIPPEADITAPRLAAYVDPTVAGTLDIHGTAAASRSTGYRYTLDVAHGLEPLEDDFTSIASSGPMSAEINGILGTWDLSTIPAALWSKPATFPVEPWTGAQDFTWTLRLRVHDDDGNVAETRKTIAVHHDPSAAPGFPKDVGAGGTGARIVDLDGDGADEIVMATNDGRVHAFRTDGSAQPGFPVATGPARVFDASSPVNYLSAPAYATGDLRPYPEAIAGTVAVGDLEGDGDLEIVAATLGDGKVYVWEHDGVLRAGFPVAMPRSLSALPASPKVPKQRTQGAFVNTGFYASPVLEDLDGDGTLEIIEAGQDHYVYVWKADGSSFAPFPVYVKDRLCFGGRHGIVSSPAVGDLNQDGRPEIVFSTQCRELHAIQTDGTELGGWPQPLPGGLDIFDVAMAGAPAGPALADVDPTPGLEVAIAGWWGPSMLFDANGRVLRTFQTAPGPLTDAGPGGAGFLNISASGAFGDLTGDGLPEYAQAGTQPAFSLERIAYPGTNREIDHGMRVWNSATGASLPAFPRRVEDYSFFYMTPVVADVGGTKKREVIQGTGGWLVHAFDASGNEPSGWPKFTHGWTLSPAAVGSFTSASSVDVVQSTLEGYLFVWRTEGDPAQNDQWWTAGHDERGTRVYRSAGLLP